MILVALIVMLITQAVVVAASLAVPVLGPQIAAELGFRPELIGYYTSLVFIGALFSGQIAPFLVRRAGPVRVSQAAAAAAACGLAVSALGAAFGVAAGALLIGLAYGPGNPASSSLLAAVAPPGRRGFYFSLKQTAVPIGGTAAGAVLPLLAARIGIDGAILAMAAVCLGVAAAVQPWRARLDPGHDAGSRPAAGSPLRLLAAHRRLRALAVVSACMACVQFSVSAVFVSFLVQTTGVGLTKAGTAFSVAMGTSVLLRIVLGGLADRFGGGRILAALGMVMAGSAALCGLVAARVIPAGFPVLAAATVLLGTAAFSWNGVYLAEVAAAAPKAQVGTATAGTMSFVFLGGIFGPVLFTTATVAAGNYGGGMAFAAVLAAVAALLMARPRTEAPV